MAITVKRKEREIRDSGFISFDVVAGDVGKTYDFMGIPEGFRIVDVNVTVDEAFANDNNNISVGIEGDLVRFVPSTVVNSVKGIGFNNRQLTATQTMAVLIDITGDASAAGKATVTVMYAKLPVSKQEY
jgi:hypothetical protein